MHGALSPDSPKAHDACCRWMHAINLHVGTLRRGRSIGIDKRPPALLQRRNTSDAAAKAEQLSAEAAALGSSDSCATNGVMPEERSVRASTTADMMAVDVAEVSDVGWEAMNTLPADGSAAGDAVGQAAGEAPATLPTCASQSASRGGRKGIVIMSKPLGSYKTHGALLRAARQRGKERSLFLKKLNRKIEQHKKVCPEGLSIVRVSAAELRIMHPACSPTWTCPCLCPSSP